MQEKLSTENTIDRGEFMRRVGMSLGGILLMNCLSGCGSNEIPDPIDPINTGKIDFTIDTNLPAYASLRNPGGWVVINDKKIIVARTIDPGSNFIAVQSNCTHEGTTLNYSPQQRGFICPSHNSAFSEDGKVARGPATQALKTYRYTYTANTGVLRIYEV